jgi:hypothetical protein
MRIYYVVTVLVVGVCMPLVRLGPKPGAKNSDSSHTPNLPPPFFELFYLHQFTFKLFQTWLKRVKPTEEPAG